MSDGSASLFRVMKVLISETELFCSAISFVVGGFARFSFMIP